MHYVGIDHHRQYSHITLLDEKAEIVKSGRVANLRRELEKFLQGIGKIKAVIEAGRSSYTMVDVLDDMGIETAVAHPKDVKAIAKAKVKTDERDSYKLAHLLRRGYIPEVYKRSRENRSSQRVLGLLCGETDICEEPAAGASGAAGQRDTARGCSGGGSFHSEGDEGAYRFGFAGEGGEDGRSDSSDLSASSGPHQRDERFSR